MRQNYGLIWFKITLLNSEFTNSQITKEDIRSKDLSVNIKSNNINEMKDNVINNANAYLKVLIPN